MLDEEDEAWVESKLEAAVRQHTTTGRLAAALLSERHLTAHSLTSVAPPPRCAAVRCLLRLLRMRLLPRVWSSACTLHLASSQQRARKDTRLGWRTSATVRRTSSTPSTQRCSPLACCRLSVSVCCCLLSSSHYAAPSWSERLSSLPQLYSGTELAAHSRVDVNKYFLLTDAQQRMIPPQLLAPVAEELRLTGGYMQLHESYIPFIERLGRVHDGPSGRAALMKPIGVHGSHGVGKSALLTYLSLWAKERGWLVVAVRADEFSMEKMGWIQPSSDRPSIFEQPLYTQHWLNQLAASQPQLLSSIALKGSYPFADPASCRTLLDLIHMARDDAALATSVLYATVSELRSAREVAVLVLMDNVNVWDGLSQFVDPDSRTARPLPARRLALVDALSTFQHVAPQLGASVFATTAHATKRNLHSHFNTRKVRPVLLQPYSHRALQHALVHYHVSGVLIAEVDAQLVGKVKMLSGAMPKDVKQAALAM